MIELSLVEPMSLVYPVSDDCGLPSLSLVLKSILGWVVLYVVVCITWACFCMFMTCARFWVVDDGCLWFTFSHVSVALVFI